ncbi:MAG: hypothetical protein K6T59_06940 [Bryobacteraceae bacterium]|jgi:hypothetical protein|nr:hypothetical protein [Bryobacteraceae bacterium]
MKTYLACLAVLGLLAGGAVRLLGQARGKSVTISGEIVDTACYIGHDSKGAAHAKCATMCAKAGIPLALLDSRSGLLYLPVSLDHKNPNERLLPFVEKKVQVTGTVLEKAGMRGIVIRQIAEAR